MSLKIEMLRCFATVAEYGNLADAAHRLNRSQAAVSLTLKQLEEHLGKPLFETDRKSKLSELGQFVLEQAQNELRQFDRMVQTIEHYAQAGTGLVRVASVPSVAGTVLPQVLKQFVEHYPNVQIELRDMDSIGVLRALRHERADIGIATIPDNARSTSHTPLFIDNFGLVCSPDNPLGRGTRRLKWKALKDETFIANELCRTIRSPTFQTIHQQANLNVHNIVSLLAMVKADIGVTVLPRMVMQLHPGEAVFRAIDDLQAVRQIDMLHRPGNNTSSAVDAFSQFIVKAVRDVLRDTVHLL